MYKVLRLALKNLRKHIGESVSLALLIAVCTALIGGSFSAMHGIENLFYDAMEKTGCYENNLILFESDFDDRIMEWFGDNDKIKRYDTLNMSGGLDTKFLNSAGQELSLTLYFTDIENEEKLEKFNVETTLSDEEISALDHPVYLPFTAKDVLGCRINRSFDVVIGNKKYSYTVAGFYESGIFSDPSIGMKLVVSDPDYALMNSVLTEYRVIVFDAALQDDGTDLMYEFIDACENEYNFDTMNFWSFMDYYTLKLLNGQTVKTILTIMLIMSVVIIVAVAVMIRYRIRSDIEKQIVSIGVLEALGYRWREISFSYVSEYLIIALAGIAAGTGGGILLSDILLMLGKMLSGHHSTAGLYCVPFAVCAAAIFAAAGIISYSRAVMVRKYPPVTAMRRGIGNNHFSADILPVKNTRHSVHLRLALRGFFGNIRQSAGSVFCILVSTAAVVLCFMINGFFGNSLNVIRSVLGIEVSSFHLELNSCADAEAVACEIAELGGVRKTIASASINTQVRAFDDMHLLPQVYSSFDLTENISPEKGRLPEHDNEVMITTIAGNAEKVNVGDTIALEYNRIKRNYIVCGIVSSMGNGGQNLYITEAGMKRMDPSYRQGAVEVYLDEGADASAVKDTILRNFGRGISDSDYDNAQNGTYEDRIRARADKKISEILGAYGASHVEYAVISDGKMITGTSSGFAVSSVIDISSVVEMQTSGLTTAVSAATVVFMILAAVTDMIVLMIIMRSGVRKNYRNFGIMKSMGYTSRELMIQLASEIMPSVIFGVVTGTLVSMVVRGLITSYIGSVPVDIPAVIILDAVIIMFCFVCALAGARRIRKITVCELVSE